MLPSPLYPPAPAAPGDGDAREQDALLEMVSDAVAVEAPDGRIRYWNAGAHQLFGFSREQAIGKTFEDLLGPDAGLSAADRASLAERGSWSGEVMCVAADATALCVERRCRLLRDADGQPAALLAVHTDVTERRRAEKEIVLLNNVLERRIQRRSDELEQSNDELRNFAYSLAHDLRAPLASIDGFSAQLASRLDGKLDERSQHYLRRVRSGVRLMSDLTDALLSLAHLSSAQLMRQSVDLSALARGIARQLQEEQPQRQVVFTIAETVRANGDSRMLGEMLEHLLGNAWKFTARTARAEISFGADADPTGGWVYHVHDNGAGFDPGYAHKLFGPFQRLHTPDEFEGNGIGLALVRKIVSRHGGRVWAQAEPGAGASFYFTLNEGGSARPGTEVPAASVSAPLAATT